MMKINWLNKKFCGFFLGFIILISVPVFVMATNTASKQNNSTPKNPSVASSLGNMTLAPMIAGVMPSIVNIETQGVVPVFASPNKKAGPNPAPEQEEDGDDNEGPEGDGASNGQRMRKFAGLGSGVILDGKLGYIITNSHVIRNANVVTVTLHDGRRLTAKIVGTDSATDIAVLQLRATDLPSVALGDSNKAKVGDFVVAIGNPFGLSRNGANQTASFGIISAMQRNDLRIEGVENFIQTDAAINPGNSGGALVNIHGELIGINTAILAPYGGNIGIGFAIPINMVRDVVQQLIKYGSIHRGLLGIYVQELTPELASAFQVKNTNGAIVTQVNAGSPAAQAGLQAGDVINEINNTSITNASQVKNIIGLLRVGSDIVIKVTRDGKRLEVKTHVTDLKQNEAKIEAQNPFLYGLFLRDISEESPLHGHIQGVAVIGLAENSAAWRSGIRPGDIIIRANREKVTNMDGLIKIAQQSKDSLLVHILRREGSLFLVIK